MICGGLGSGRRGRQSGRGRIFGHIHIRAHRTDDVATAAFADVDVFVFCESGGSGRCGRVIVGVGVVVVVVLCCNRIEVVRVAIVRVWNRG